MCSHFRNGIFGMEWKNNIGMDPKQKLSSIDNFNYRKYE